MKSLKVGDYVNRAYYPNNRGRIISIKGNIVKVIQKSDMTFEAYLHELHRVYELPKGTFGRHRHNIKQEEDKNGNGKISSQIHIEE